MTDNQTTRRDLLATAVLSGAALLAAQSSTLAQAQPAANDAAKPMEPEYYELRAYHLVRGPMLERLGTYLKEAFIPAAGKAGCGLVGVFAVTIGFGNPTLYVLIPHASLDSFLTLPGKLAADANYAKAADAFLSTPPTDPPYASLDVKLMRAFPHFPKVEVPAATAKKEARIFELRTYRSHGERAGIKKIEMFDTAGEIAIFRKNGLTPVFFAQDLTGPGLPSLTYLLTFPDLATREKSWNAFRVDPDWKKLSSTPGFTDPEIVTGIDNQVLAPTAYSQI